MSVLRLCCAVLLAPALVAAQPAPGAARAMRPGQDPAAVPPPPSAPAPEPAVDTHTVQRGDTLWDLSARYLNSPWYWPKVWSLNPEIGNPHWIYPGNVIRLRAPGSTPPAAAPVADEDGEPARELDGLSVADMDKPQQYGDVDDVTVGGPYKIGYQPRSSYRLRRDSFVTPSEVEESGTITGAFEDKLLLTIHDRVYARFRGGPPVQPGSTYVLYRTEGEVRHPVTGDLFGYKTRVLGAARVIRLDKEVATLEVTRAFEPIERGSLVGNWTEAVVKNVRPRPNRRFVSGFIIATHQQVLSAIGEHNVVFVDRGSVDGVEEGNLFTVVRAGDPYGRSLEEQARDGRDRGLPAEDVGVLMVVDTRENSSAALVVRSVRELHVGEPVEMRAPSAGALEGPVPAAASKSSESR